jgi:hypothetical protein
MYDDGEWTPDKTDARASAALESAWALVDEIEASTDASLNCCPDDRGRINCAFVRCWTKHLAYCRWQITHELDGVDDFKGAPEMAERLESAWIKALAAFQLSQEAPATEDVETDSSSDSSESEPVRKKRKRSSKRRDCHRLCIGVNVHARQWEGQEAHLAAFDEFVNRETTKCVDSRVAGGALWERYTKTAAAETMLWSRHFGYCCALRFCKSRPNNVATYHGIKLR